MFNKSYLKTALRTLRRRKGFTALNVFGLAVGLAAALLIALYVGHERSYDDFHQKADRLYRVLFDEGGQITSSLPIAVARQLRREYPAVETAAAVSPLGEELIAAGSERFYEDGLARAGASFFEMFSFAPVAGDPRTALEQPGSAVLTREAARKYFGDASAVGQTITRFDVRRFSMAGGGISIEMLDQVVYTVRAVVEAPPSTSSIDFDVLLSQPQSILSAWNVRGAQVYLLLQEGTSAEALRAQLPAFVKRHGGPFAESLALRLQPLPEAHLYPSLGTAEGLSPASRLRIFLAAALLILLIACVNYMNLATARSAERAREVGVRKTVGAGRGELALQFLGEAVLVAFLALGVALLLTVLLLPPFSSLLGADLSFQYLPGGIFTLVGVALGVGLLSGSYPAAVLSGYRPARVLKGLTTPGRSGAWLRKGLVVFQFAASVALILAAVTIYRQMAFIRAERTGVGQDAVVTVPLRGETPESGYRAFKRSLLNRPAVASVTTGTVPGFGGFRLSTSLDTTGRFEYLNLLLVGDDYLETLGIDVVAGASFETARVGALDSARVVLVNETAARMAGREGLIGRRNTHFNDGTVIGIVEDFHLGSFYEPIGPVALQHISGVGDAVLLRLESGQIAAGLDALREAWSQFVPNRPLNYSFLDDRLAEAYRADRRMGRLLGAFSFLAVLIAGLGLFGLAAYTAQHRTKEIGIRKALGATVPSIVALLSKDFLKLVVLAFAIGAPLAYLAVQRWLADFAYRIEVGAGIFLLTGVGVLVTALAAVGVQALKAAWTNPAEALRTEA